LSKYILFLFLSLSLFAKEVHPTAVFKSMGFVNNFVVNEDKLYVATTIGVVNVFDMNTQKIINQIVLPPLISKMNKIIPQNAISIDYLNGKILIVSIGKNAYRNVWVYENNELKQIIDESKKMTIKKALFVNDERVLFGTFGSEVILHDIGESYNVYKTHIAQSTIGGIILNRDKTKIIISHESGEVKVVDAKSSDVDTTYSSEHVDYIYDVASTKDIIITGGQDRRVGVYQKNAPPYHLKSHFMVYCVALSPSGKIGAFSSGDEQNIQLFDIKTKAKTDILVAHTSRLNQIYFLNENELLTAGNKNNIFYWKLD